MPPVKKEEDRGEEAAAASLGLEEEKAKEKARKVPAVPNQKCPCEQMWSKTGEEFTKYTCGSISNAYTR